MRLVHVFVPYSLVVIRETKTFLGISPLVA
jgi:hypothetical protein